MDVVILLIVTACGALGAPLQVVIVAALVLTAMSAKRKFEIARLRLTSLAVSGMSAKS